MIIFHPLALQLDRIIRFSSSTYEGNIPFPQFEQILFRFISYLDNPPHKCKAKTVPCEFGFIKSQHNFRQIFYQVPIACILNTIPFIHFMKSATCNSQSSWSYHFMPSHSNFSFYLILLLSRNNFIKITCFCLLIWNFHLVRGQKKFIKIKNLCMKWWKMIRTSQQFS